MGNFISNKFLFIRFFLKELNIETPLIKLSELKVSGKKSDLVLNMCKKLKSKVYIFGAQGRDYANEKKFMQSGIKPYYQQYNHPVYKECLP